MSIGAKTGSMFALYTKLVYSIVVHFRLPCIIESMQPNESPEIDSAVSETAIIWGILTRNYYLPINRLTCLIMRSRDT